MLLFQRATLAEKEVTTLKEQLQASGNSGCETKEGSMEKPNFENELAAKDKEVRVYFSVFYFTIASFYILFTIIVSIN